MYKMRLTDIKYPIFPLREHVKVENVDDVLYVHSLRGSWILDNKNLPGETLAIRRFRISNSLYPLNKAIFNLAQLINNKSRQQVYIDKFGTFFKYRKSKRCK